MVRPSSPAVGTLAASCAAGPVFLWASAAAQGYLMLPQPIHLEAQDLLMLAMLSVPAAVVGFFLALVPAGIGSLVMYRLGKLAGTPRMPATWISVGGAVGGAIAYLFRQFPERPQFGFGFVAAGAVCAYISRRFVAWDTDA